MLNLINNDISKNSIVVIATLSEAKGKQSHYQQDCFGRSSLAMTYFIVFRDAHN